MEILLGKFCQTGSATRCLGPRLVAVGEGELDVDAGLQLDVGDVQDLGPGALELDDPLVDPHLVPVPRLGTLTAGGLPGGDPHAPGGHGAGALDLDGLGVVGVVVHGLGAAGDLGAGLVHGAGVGGGDGDPDVGGVLLLDFVVLVLGHG